jgi:tRNA threonylcarbamoyl adenosine modification protein (Sua5/YciO/YrdC/YwlC family)
MATLYTLHPETPQVRRIEEIIEALRGGAVMLYPTDTVYAIGCDLNAKSAVERVRQIKQLSSDKPLTFLCPSLSNISQYAIVSDPAYRLIKHLIPGPYTFLLPATKLVPRLVMNPKRKTTGIRVPDHAICQALLRSLGTPIISTSAPTAAQAKEQAKEQAIDPIELFDRLDHLVDIVIDDESPMRYKVSTILDLTTDEPVVLRRGVGWDAVDYLPQLESTGSEI